MQRKFSVLMWSVFLFLFFITTFAFALTRSQEEEKLRYFKYAYEKNQMIYRISDEEKSDLGVAQIRQKYRWTLEDSRGGIFVMMPRNDIINKIKQDYERKRRMKWEKTKGEQGDLRRKVGKWIRMQENKLGSGGVKKQEENKKTNAVIIDKKEPTFYSRYLDKHLIKKWKGSDVLYCMVHLVKGKDLKWPRSCGNTSTNLDQVIKDRSYHPEYTILVYTVENGVKSNVAEYRPIFGEDGKRLRVEFILDKNRIGQWKQ